MIPTSLGETTIIRPVILCGGAGTRLWPVSRERYPKQLLRLTGEQSLLQQTVDRLSGEHFAPAIVVSAEEQRFFIVRQLKEIAAEVDSILLEPVARNTAPAIALAAAWLNSTDRDELILVVPSDHVIGNQQAFLDAVAVGASYAKQGAIVTFGAKPTEPNTQFGYIEAKVDLVAADVAFPIARFREKPQLDLAKEYVASGRFFWNCGIFLMRGSTLLDEMRQFLPASLEAITTAIQSHSIDGLFARPDPKLFAKAENISIDHGIMEKTSRGMVVPVDMNWSDVGAWDAVWKLGKKDPNENVTQGNVIAIDTRNSLLRTDGRAVVAAVGLENMAVIAVSDAIFVAPIDRVSDVKEVVSLLKKGDQTCTILPAKVARPWGSYETVANGPHFQVKHIIVDPGEALSLQMHVHRSEHWVVVRGSAEVTVGEQVSILQENESTFIPAGTKHRLANTGEAHLELIEIQCGAYLGEDDIVRFEDKYGRAAAN